MMEVFMLCFRAGELEFLRFALVLPGLKLQWTLFTNDGKCVGKVLLHILLNLRPRRNKWKLLLIRNNKKG